MSDANTLFITATRERFLFASIAGQLSVEDLWDLPLTGRPNKANLDDIARGLHKELKDADGEVSFVKPAVKTTSVIQAKFDLVKYIIGVKMEERDARAASDEKAATKQKLLAKLAEKKDAELDNKSAEDIQAMIDSL